MSEPAPQPTPFSEVNSVLFEFRSELQKTLGPLFFGLYIHGSLASGDFNPHTSDIDFLVVTAGELPGEMLAALSSMHARLRAGGQRWATRLEGAYIPLGALRRYDPVQARHPWLGVDGHFAVEQLGSDWVIQRHILREMGIVLAGPPPRSLIDPVEPDDLRLAVRRILQEWWSSPFPYPERFQSGEYQAYAILTMCRSLYVLQNGRIASKPAAGRWAWGLLGEPWAGLIEYALAWQPGEHRNKLDETLNFIRFTIERSQPGPRCLL
jgi:hypothetical protein